MTENELKRTSILTQLAHRGGTRSGSESISPGSQVSLKAARDQHTNGIKCFWKLNYTHVATVYANQHVVWPGMEVQWGLIIAQGRKGAKEDLVLTSNNSPYHWGD